MTYLCLLLLLISLSQVFERVQGQCAGGIWPIEDPSIGMFSVSWQYNLASNTVQFILQGQAISSINLTSTYIAIGWSDTAPNMNKMDVAMFFPGTQIVQDRYSRGHVVPTVDSQQDFCVIHTNITGQNVYVSFERFLTTGDPNDISFIPNLYLMFSMGLYTLTNGTNSFAPQHHFFRVPLQTLTSLISCTTAACLTTSCTTSSCPCLQLITSGAAQCTCFPPSSCVSGSTITPRTTMTTTTIAILATSSNMIGSCQSQPNPCSSNGICFQTSSTEFMCRCVNGYTGTLCQTALSSASIMNCSCLNGGVCLTNGTCSCSIGFTGTFCQLTNPCVNYCHNNGACTVVCTSTSCSTPNCTCANGFTGVQCDNLTNSSISTGACQSNPCVNGYCTTTSTGGFQCQCTTAFVGTRCDLVNSCFSNPCNQGTCVPLSNCTGQICGYTCLCANGTSGTNCGISLNPCSSAPCKNGGICSNSLTGSDTYSCQCVSPYGGTQCDQLINVCTPNPCLNNGICTLMSTIQNGTYRCNCPTGFVGGRCEYVSGCNSSPCQNNGQCVSTTNNCSSSICPAQCICSIGTTGTYCEQQDITCLTIPCLNGGVCSINGTTNTLYCQCPPSTTGVRCETLTSVCTSATCSNQGVCFIDASSGNQTARCLCFQGFTGQFCQSLLTSTLPCAPNPCGSNGTCISASNSSYYCLCPNGAIGQSCNSNPLTSCISSPCRYLSTCQQVPNTNPATFMCVCPDYLTGDRCQYTNNCRKQPCLNQGTCIPLGPQNSFMCNCPLGFSNYDCSTYLGLNCSSIVCLNGGICQSNSSNIQCICPANFAGPHCEWTSVCSSNTCLNGGTCRQIAPTMAECLCQTGFTGPTCSSRDSCATSPCKNGGGCTTLLADTGTNWSAYRCVCPSGFYGQNCDMLISSCSNMVCPSYKICSEQATGPMCTCAGNKVGTFCQYDSPCSPSTGYCLNQGTCVSSNTDPPVATCLCPAGYTGTRCSATLQNDPCANNPCQTRGYCALSSSNGSYTCVCQADFVGDRCERSNPCLSSPCANQAICQASWNTTNTWFTCVCVGTFTGTRCETSLLNPCGGLCMNGSPCNNGVCVCPAQYTGTFCGFANPCYYPICRNGGYCSANYNATSVSFTCTCSNSYTGQYCETPVYVQANTSCSPACVNGGSCANGICTCTSGYVGPTCQYINPCITQNPCLNSGTCFGKYNIDGTLSTQCFCLQGYTGNYCEATLCSSNSCNGGLCTATQNSIVCICPKGKIGDRCQYADACANNPCLPNEQCQQTGNQYQCISCYDQSPYCATYQLRNEYCDNRYTILLGNVFVPVPQACQRSCGQCIPVQRLQDIAPLFETDTATFTISIDSEDNTTEHDSSTSSIFLRSTTATTTSAMNMIFSRTYQCVDRRKDCSRQKRYGFCGILHEKYPHDCSKTCNPDCNKAS